MAFISLSSVLSFTLALLELSLSSKVADDWMEDESELNYLHFLKEYVPYGLERRISMIDQNSSRKYRRIFFLSRQISTLFLVSRASQKKTPGIDFPNLLRSISLDPEEALDLFTPLEVQSLSYFLEFLHGHTTLLAKAVSTLSNHSEFPYITSCLLPALFCHFSTLNAAGLALNFYVSSLEFYDVEHFISFVFPFFTSSAVAPFSDHLFREVFWVNYLAKPQIPSFAERLLTVAVSSLRFLPHCHLALLRLLLFKWTISDVWILLIHALIIPQIQIQCELSPFNYCSGKPPIDTEKLCRFLSEISVKHSISVPLTSADLSLALFEIPSNFVPYNGTFNYECLFTVKDIRTLFLLPLELPNHFKTLASLGGEDIDIYKPFFVRYFTKTPRPPESTIRSLVFPEKSIIEPTADSSIVQIWFNVCMAAELTNKDPLQIIKEAKSGDPKLDVVLSRANRRDIFEFGVRTTIFQCSQRAQLFEAYLTRKIEYKQLQKWNQIVKGYSLLISFNRAKRISTMAPSVIPQKYISRIWPTIQSLNQICSVKYWFALQMLSSAEKTILEPHKAEIESLEKRFEAMLQKMKPRYEKKPKTESKLIEKRLWEASGLVSLVDLNSSFLGRYLVLINFLEEIERAAATMGGADESVPLIHFCIVAYEGNWIMKTYIYMQCVGFSNEKFSELCFDSTVERWKRFTSTFFLLLANDEQLLSDIANYITNRHIRIE